jgi:putative ABC transport system permease protein
LADFAYRIEITWPVFAEAGLLGLLVALLTVGGHAMKAALTDPVKVLRYE